MQNRREGAERHFLAQDRRDVVVRLAGVDDERQSEFARERDLGAKDLLGDVRGRVIVVIVQPRLADADALGVGGKARIAPASVSGSSPA